MTNMKNDWRYTNQERYLHDKTFSLRKYDIPYPEHSHCEFCWIKFGAGGECQEGYTDENEDSWICPQCFEDFKELLFGEWHCSLLEAKVCGASSASEVRKNQTSAKISKKIIS